MEQTRVEGERPSGYEQLEMPPGGDAETESDERDSGRLNKRRGDEAEERKEGGEARQGEGEGEEKRKGQNEEGGDGEEGSEVEQAFEEGKGKGTAEQVGPDEVTRLRSEVATAVERLAALYRERGDVVPELITGSSVAALDAALVVAQQAYANLMGRAGQPGSGVEGSSVERRAAGRVVVSAGGGERRSGPNAAGLSAVQKIALGLEQRMK